MDMLNARPGLLKQANLSLVRRTLRDRGTATRAEIAETTGISSTTVRTLLEELEAAGEVGAVGFDASSGGRKAQRYRLRPDRYFGAAVCMTDHRADGLVVDACGQIVEARELEAAEGGLEAAVLAFLDGVTARRDIRAIGVGVPGVVDNGCYWKKRREDYRVRRVPLGEDLARRYGVPVVLENDVKAVAVGVGKCYAREFPGEDPGETNMAYLHFDSGCVSAGFLVGGKVLHGATNCAGELGLVPVGGDRLLDEQMAQPMDDGAYIDRMIQIIGWVCGVLNPQYVAIGGPDVREDCIGPIGDGLSALLPDLMSAELLHAPDVWHDYHEGMASLTAARMFDQVQFVRE